MLLIVNGLLGDILSVIAEIKHCNDKDGSVKNSFFDMYWQFGWWPPLGSIAHIVEIETNHVPDASSTQLKFSA